jgi:hypothetical protein
MTEQPWYYDAYVGQKVVCVDACGFPLGWAESPPKEGKIYTVRQVVRRTSVGLLLCEIVNEPRLYADGFLEAAFCARRFRPAVQPRKELPESITKYLNVPGRVDA